MAGAGQVFSSGTKFHRHADFMDQIPCHRADDMSAENTVGLSIRKDFHKALGGEICFRATIAHK